MHDLGGGRRPQGERPSGGGLSPVGLAMVRPEQRGEQRPAGHAWRFLVSATTSRLGLMYREECPGSSAMPRAPTPWFMLSSEVALSCLIIKLLVIQGRAHVFVAAAQSG